MSLQLSVSAAFPLVCSCRAISLLLFLFFFSFFLAAMGSPRCCKAKENLELRSSRLDLFFSQLELQGFCYHPGHVNKYTGCGNTHNNRPTGVCVCGATTVVSTGFLLGGPSVLTNVTPSPQIHPDCHPEDLCISAVCFYDTRGHCDIALPMVVSRNSDSGTPQGILMVFRA